MASAGATNTPKIVGPGPMPSTLPPKVQADLKQAGKDVVSTGKTVAKLGTDVFTGGNAAADAKTLGQNIQALQADKTNLQNDIKSYFGNKPIPQAFQKFLNDAGSTIQAGQQFVKSPTAQNWQTLMQDGQKLTPDMQGIVGGTGLGKTALQTVKDLGATGTTVGKLTSDFWSGASPTADAETLGQNLQALQADMKNLQQGLPQLPAKSPLAQHVQAFLTDGGKTIQAGQQFVKALDSKSQMNPSPATRAWQTFLADGQKLLPDVQKILGDINPQNGSPQA